MAKTKGFGIVPQYLLLGVFIATGGSNANISPYLQWLGVAYFSGIDISVA